ncbi:hypothetical protein ABKN59_002722 [Abortiporus biennis]
MQLFVGLLLAIGFDLVTAHGDHHSGPAPGETIQEYARRHMSSEHHIDNFDTPSFFLLHDLNRDGIWDRDELEAVYGVHHVYSKRKTPDEEKHQQKADHITNTVLKILDTDGDGKVSMKELEDKGIGALPNFDDLGAEGHHYDVESEFFLHHEEEFHNTPETQTDDSYTHPEDLEHFATHESIERQEAEREAKFQGITVDEALKQHEPHDEPHAPEGQHVGEEQQPLQRLHDEHPATESQVVESPATPKFTRIPDPAKVDPVERYQNIKKAANGNEEWGTGESGYKTPSSPSDRMKKNVPYKYKFRRTWGDF